LQLLQRRENAHRISADSVGCKSLTGGALGKDIGRVRQVAPAVTEAVKRVMVEFVESAQCCCDELVFSAEFSTEERRLMRSEALINRLDQRYYHVTPAVYVIVSRQRSPMDVVNHLRVNGGENRQYCLLER